MVNCMNSESLVVKTILTRLLLFVLWPESISVLWINDQEWSPPISPPCLVGIEIWELRQFLLRSKTQWLHLLIVVFLNHRRGRHSNHNSCLLFPSRPFTCLWVRLSPSHGTVSRSWGKDDINLLIRADKLIMNGTSRRANYIAAKRQTIGDKRKQWSSSEVRSDFPLQEERTISKSNGWEGQKSVVWRGRSSLRLRGRLKNDSKSASIEKNKNHETGEREREREREVNREVKRERGQEREIWRSRERERGREGIERNRLR
jgi:hypothetical protein